MALPRAAIDGRLAADPTLRFAQSGNAVASLRMVASDRKLNQQTQQWEDGDTLWIDVTCFGKLAENVCESVQKGDLLLVHGRLRTEEWDDRDSGQKRSKIALIADSVAVSLAFRQLPHAGATHEARAQRPAQPPPASTDPWGTPASEPDPPF
jgi:single-strand DNA-binding protein